MKRHDAMGFLLSILFLSIVFFGCGLFPSDEKGYYIEKKIILDINCCEVKELKVNGGSINSEASGKTDWYAFEPKDNVNTYYVDIDINSSGYSDDCKLRIYNHLSKILEENLYVTYDCTTEVTSSEDIVYFVSVTVEFGSINYDISVNTTGN